MNNRGQFSIIAALLISIILVSTVILTYTAIRNDSIQVQPQVLTAIDETNFAIKRILGFSVGYFGSVIRVTGDTSFANKSTLDYTSSGLEYVANTHAEWGAGFSLTNLTIGTYWFNRTSYSTGYLGVTYNLTKLGINGMQYAPSSTLAVQITNMTQINQTSVTVTKEQNEPVTDLEKQNFKFFKYATANSTWVLVPPSSNPLVYTNGTYQIQLPVGIDANSYVLQVEDKRGIIVVASSFSSYTMNLIWPSIYSNATSPALTIELLQNGAMRWLGQSLQLTTQAMPIPPLPVKSIHVNQTVNGINSEIPFQIEDWASGYLVPLGMTGNSSVFGDGNMIVFLANNNVSKVTIWWNGSDLATQTPYAFTNRYFKGDNPSAGTLTNGILTLQFTGNFQPVISSVVGASCTATFMRLNSQASTYGASTAYVIASGVVRDIVQQEAEWSNGAPNSPNLYAHIVLTLPANATYYTYQLRAMFVQSQQSRTITDLCPIKLQSSITQAQTENGTAGGYPIVSTATGTFYNQSTVWAHHWSQLISGANGAGIMFTDTGNNELYSFDSMAGTKTGGLRVNAAAGTIELHPVEIASVSFTHALNTIWSGAVSTFSNTTPIYKTASGQVSGSWIIVEYPPTAASYTGN
jgi:hypothetical protein